MDTSLNIFNTDVTFDTKDLSKEEMVSELVPRLQDILDAHFPNDPRKRQIKVYNDRISFAAPCCGDSYSDSTKKRGNIITNGKYRNFYKCFNCGAFMPVTTFFEKYGGELSLDLIDYFSKNKSDVSVKADNKGVRLLSDTSAINELAFDREWFKNFLHLEETNIPNAGNTYLKRRRQFMFENFLYNAQRQILFIVNLTDEGRIYGMQVKHLDKEYRGPKYMTYNLTKMYEKLLNKTDVQIDPRIDQFSMIFNILRVDCSKPVNVFEGPMDAFLMKNSIALCGASKRINFGFRSRYVYDDDETGRKHAMETLDNGYEVFLWNRFKKDIGLPRKKKWDLNDVVMWCDQNRVKIPRLDDYFSSDSFDSMDI